MEEESNIIFRKAEEPVVEVIKLPVALGEQTKEMTEEVKPPIKIPPLNLYHQVRGHPYSVDYFDLGTHWEFANYPQEIQTIEDFVGKEIKRMGLENTIESYQEIIAKLKEKIGISDNERTWHKLDKLVAYIKALKGIKKWEDKKLQIEGIYGTT